MFIIIIIIIIIISFIACQSSRVLDGEINWKSSLKYQTGISPCSVAIHCRQSKPWTKFFEFAVLNCDNQT